jgi:hypothetical protein
MAGGGFRQACPYGYNRHMDDKKAPLEPDKAHGAGVEPRLFRNLMGGDMTFQMGDLVKGLSGGFPDANLSKAIESFRAAMPPTPDSELFVTAPEGLTVSEHMARGMREEEEQRARGVKTVQLLDAILGELREQRKEIGRQAAKLREHDDELVRIRSGGTGRPSSMHLVLEELKRRGIQKLESSQVAQAKVLASWLRRAHPSAAPTSPKTITNNAEFRTLYRQLRATRPK